MYFYVFLKKIQHRGYEIFVHSDKLSNKNKLESKQESKQTFFTDLQGSKMKSWFIL